MVLFRGHASVLLSSFQAHELLSEILAIIEKVLSVTKAKQRFGRDNVYKEFILYLFLVLELKIV